MVRRLTHNHVQSYARKCQTTLPLTAPLSSELRLPSASGPDDNSDLEPLLQRLSSERGGDANSSPSFPSVTLFLSSSCFKQDLLSFRSVLLNLLHQRFGFAFDSFFSPFELF